ncbi:zinc-dependent peptidase [Aurantiacibacter luteus]|uniref:Zinc-dependent peptidase n=1 Tax=Aurantiacibacter luteus TaxID=1581420 RepID=A0A0G9MVI8_9SPHN|nr:M90 family metallopeptidase [Aurantiacibacter luteus]KLE34721.1 hypothetical protein AAW00_11235 [Aurantiacibacter luteus]
MTLVWILLALLLVAGGLSYRGWAKARHRDRLLASPLTDEQRAIVMKLVPMVRRLPAELRPALEGRINRFLDQVTFHGYGGVEIDDGLRLSVAAQACLLVVNSPDWFETLRTVLVYPSAFDTRRPRHDGELVHENGAHAAGESWARGPVVLSWDHALRGGLDPDDGHNVVMHEFAHQLDSLTGQANGVPLLRKGQRFDNWERAMLDAYEGHVRRVEAGHATLIDPYGATNHQEFFAEATVTFFEKPAAFRREEPALYAELATLFALDPAEWA